MKKQKETPGGIVKIKFDDLFHTYGRILNYGDVALYDCRVDKDITDLHEIIKRPILYKMIVNEGGVKYGRWPIVGILPLEEALQNSKYYLEEIGRTDVCKLIENGKITFDIPIEQSIGLTTGGVWDPARVEEVLRDHYAGRKNVYLNL
jgi:hypothetical protein